MGIDLILISLTGFVKDLRKEDIAFAIKKDVNLKNLILKMQSQSILGSINFIKTTGYFKRDIEKDFGYVTVLDWLKNSRPDLHEEITASKTGTAWFRKNMEDIKKMLLNEE